MGVVRVQVADIAHANNATSIAVTFTSNVTSGNLVVFAVGCYRADEMLVGDLTKTAGTATIGTVTLDRDHYWSASNLNAGVFSVPVTGTGSLTLTLAGIALVGGTSSANTASAAEYTGIDVSATRVAAVNSGQNTGTSVASGNVTTGAAGVIIGCMTDTSSAAQTITQDGAYLLLKEEENGASYETFSFIEEIVAVNTTDSADWTLLNSKAWVGVAAAYKAAGVTNYPRSVSGAMPGGSGTVKRLRAALRKTAGTI